MYTLQLSPMTTVLAVIELVSLAMKESPACYRFQTFFPRSLVAHERLPLELLRLVNRGARRARDGQIRLAREPARTDLTLDELLGDRANFASNICLESGYFVLHLRE